MTKQAFISLLLPGTSLFRGVYDLIAGRIGHTRTKALVAVLVLLNEARAFYMVASIGSEFVDVTMMLPNW